MPEELIEIGRELLHHLEEVGESLTELLQVLFS